MLGKKPSRTWQEAELRWLEEMQHKRSICTDIFRFEWLQKHLNNYALADITRDLIESVVKKRKEEGAKDSTINRYLALIRAVLNRACNHWEWIDKVPKISLKKENNTRIRWLKREEANLLIQFLPDHLADMVKFSLATGLRESNVTGLEWSRVDIRNKHAWVEGDQAKGKKPLSVPLNKDAMEVIMKQQGKNKKYVFTFRGKPVSRCNTKAWRKALNKAGITNFRFHDLRHTWASWHVQNGTTIQELFELGGWKSFDMVLRYAHLSSSHLKAAANRITGAEMVQVDFERGLKVG